MILRIAFFCVWMGSALAAEINIVYPKVMDSLQIYEFPAGLDSSFVFGNIEPTSAALSADGVPIAVTTEGAFLAFLPLQANGGTNSWNFSLRDQGGAEIARRSLSYQFKKNSAGDSLISSPEPRLLTVTAANAHTRTIPGGSYEFFPEIGVELPGLWQEGALFCKFAISPGDSGVIESRFVTPSPYRELGKAVISNGEYDDLGYRCTFGLSRATLTRSELSADRKTLTVWVANADCAIDRIHYKGRNCFLRNVEWRRKDGGVELEFRLCSPLKKGYTVRATADGFKVFFDPVFLSRDKNLKGKTIVVDAGHGGAASGAIGPLGTQEKDVTLHWSKILEAELAKRGAHVIQTRSNDTDVSLYERADIARKHADFFVSLHANALPDGENPFKRRGCGVYFYNPASRYPAELVQTELLKATKLNDDGIFDANFAVVRPTEFPALLIEGAYLMHPEEEQLLLDDDFLKSMSIAIVRGLNQYFKSAR